MNLAVKLYRDDDNPKNIPAAWPSEVIELHEENILPDSNYILMTYEEYVIYKAARQAEYDAWELEYNQNELIKIQNEEKLALNIENGQNIVKDFALYAMTLSESDRNIFTNGLSSIISSLQLGMLQTALDNLISITDNLILNSQYSQEKTVKQYFMDKISEALV